MSNDKDKTINLSAFKRVCGSCGHQFIEGGFTGFDYGKRIFRTKGGKHRALWIGPEDECFDEFEQLIRKVVGTRLTPRSEAKLFDQIFGISCDPLNGVQIAPSQGCVCTKCGSEDVDTFEVVPKQILTETLPLVRHTLWLEKKLQERESAIRKAISDLKRVS